MSLRWLPGWIDPAQLGGKVVLHHRQHFVFDEHGPLFPREWVMRLNLPILACHGLGHFEGEPVYLLELPENIEMPMGAWRGLRQFMLETDDEALYSFLSYATQIGTWAQQNRFCGSCGSPMQARSGERAMQCPACGTQHYPRLSPSMIVLVSDGDRVLLARAPRYTPGVYSVLSGFVEPGESVEQCVAREVMEEVGVRVKDIKYVGSQSWPFPHSLMLGFHARYDGGELRLQPEEIEDAQWFSIYDLPPLPDANSIARYLVDLYCAQKKGQDYHAFAG